VSIVREEVARDLTQIGGRRTSGHAMNAGQVYFEDGARKPVRWRLAALFAVFFLGGLPALMYQVIWQRVLTMYFGVDIYSTSITVATFMFGLGAGSLCGGWLADRTGRPAIWYAGLELMMSLYGFMSLTLFSAVGSWLAGGSLATMIIADLLLLLVPTTLMGMTFPLMCRIVAADGSVIGERISWLYGLNTMGAAAGALLSAYVLIGWFGLDGATRIAASLNLILAIVVSIVVALSSPDAKLASTPHRLTEPPSVAHDRSGAATVADRSILLLSFLSGFIALGYEIVWYRILGILLHGTVYVFGTILFFFLAGNALGSLLARKHVDHGRCLHRFAACQLAIGLYSFVFFGFLAYLSWAPPLKQLTAASFFTTFHPAPELIAGTVDRFTVYSLLDIGFWPAVLLGIPTILMGYGFTNLMREGIGQIERVGRSVGALYMANIAGATLGSLSIGFGMIHYFGSENALKLLVILGALVPIIVSVAIGRRTMTEGPSGPLSSMKRTVNLAWLLLVATFIAFPGRTTILQAVHFAGHQGVSLVVAEDRTGVVAWRRQSEVIAFDQEKAILGEPRLYIDGSHHGDVSAERVPDDWGTKVTLAAHPHPRRVLSIGLGDGQMAATAALWPEVEELIVVELNSALERVMHDTAAGKSVLLSPKVKYIIDDGRRWLLAHPEEKFDVILMFPLHAAHAYSGNLYSLEFLELVSKQLSDRGILFLQTVDRYSTAKTLATVFPHVLRLDGSMYMASRSAFRIREERLPTTAAVTVPRIAADQDDILKYTSDARVNTDLSPNSEYYITYPFVSALQTRVKGPIAYTAVDAHKFWSLIVRASASSR
jgi:spermidine synthase